MVVYLITNSVNGKVYVGQSIQSGSGRWRKHKSLLRCNKHDNIHLQNAWNKYGEVVWSYKVIDRATNQAELDKLETYYIVEVYNSNDRTKGYNKSTGGEHPIISEDARQRLRVAMTGRTLPKITKDKLREVMRGAGAGRTLSAETRRKISL